MKARNTILALQALAILFVALTAVWNTTRAGATAGTERMFSFGMFGMTIFEQALSPAHPILITCRTNYVKLLRRMREFI